MDEENQQSVYQAAIKQIQSLIKKSRSQKSSIIKSTIVALYISNQSKQQNPQFYYQQKNKPKHQKNKQISYYWQFKRIGLLVLDTDRILKTNKLQLLLQFQLYSQFMRNYVELGHNFYTFQWLNYFNVGFLFKNQFQAKITYEKIQEQIQIRQQYSNQDKNKVSRVGEWLGKLKLPVYRPKIQSQQPKQDQPKINIQFNQQKQKQLENNLTKEIISKQETSTKVQSLQTVKEGFYWLKNKYNQITDATSDGISNSISGIFGIQSQQQKYNRQVSFSKQQQETLCEYSNSNKQIFNSKMSVSTQNSSMLGSTYSSHEQLGLYLNQSQLCCQQIQQNKNDRQLYQLPQLPPIPILTLIPDQPTSSNTLILQSSKNMDPILVKLIQNKCNLLKQIQQFKCKLKPVSQVEIKPQKVQDKEATLMDELTQRLKKRKQKLLLANKKKNSDSEDDENY